MLRKGLITCALAGMLTIGVTSAKTRVFVRVAPPATVIETPGSPPMAGYVWTPGYYRWDGNAYNWTAGQWVMPPHHHAHYVAGRWRHHHGQYYFEEGHWR
jgi:hypothetical protein